MRWADDPGRLASATWALLGVLGAGVLAWPAVFALRDYYLIAGGEAVSEPAGSETEALRRLLGELAVAADGAPGPEKPVPGVSFCSLLGRDQGIPPGDAGGGLLQPVDRSARP
ncbi:MAG: hypothetical protein R3F60_14590 [bacterium]